MRAESSAAAAAEASVGASAESAARASASAVSPPAPPRAPVRSPPSEDPKTRNRARRGALETPRAVAADDDAPAPRARSARAARACSSLLLHLLASVAMRLANSGSRAAHAVATSGRSTARYTCATDPLATGCLGKCAKTRSMGTPRCLRTSRAVCA